MRWSQPASIIGRRLSIETLEPAHAAEVLAAADSPEIFDWLPMAFPESLDDARGVIDFCRSRDRSWAFAQRDVSSGRLVGATGYHDMDAAQRAVAIGPTWFSRERWGTGLNAESKLLMLDYAFDVLGVVRVAWIVDTQNDRSAASIRRLGAQHEGVLRKQRARRDGSWRDVHVFSVLDDEWPTMRRRIVGLLEG